MNVSITEIQQNQINVAGQLGWTVDASKVKQVGLRFSNGNFLVWQSSYGGIHWRKCEYINGMAANHKSFATAEEAMQSGAVPDKTFGLGNHGMTPNQRVSWTTYEKPTVPGQLAWNPVKTTGVVIFAYGENGCFIRVRSVSGEEETLRRDQLKKI